MCNTLCHPRPTLRAADRTARADAAGGRFAAVLARRSGASAPVLPVDLAAPKRSRPRLQLGREFDPARRACELPS
jgi:hypothetical protein